MRNNELKKLNNLCSSRFAVKQFSADKRRGIVLLVTLILLVVLATLGYTFSARIAAQRHRDRYIIDYQAARYSCDSAVKYAMTALQDMNTPPLIDRSDKPDFSDLFFLTETEYKEFLQQWQEENAMNNPDDANEFKDTEDYNNINSPNDVNTVADANRADYSTIPGPYGFEWPFIIKPVELEIGSAKVRIQIEDENAKYPIGWVIMNNKEVDREAQAGFEIFCEWMWSKDPNIQNVYDRIDSFKEQLDQISEIKPFSMEFKKKTIKAKTVRSKRGRRSRSRKKTKSKTISVEQQINSQAVDFAKLLNSSLLDTETLARPTVVSEIRKESALKYLAMWGSRKVNINTAPRHVLEATFVFGGNEVKIADEIITQRQVEPFKDIEDLTKKLFRYSDSIKKCEKYITTVSNFFTIRVTAISGVAEASAVIAITKNGKKLQRLAVISG